LHCGTRLSAIGNTGCDRSRLGYSKRGTPSRVKSAAFLMLALGRPAHTGAVSPSSRRLAQAMAEEAGPACCLIELGAGTGAITGALHEHYPQLPLLAVELEPALADALLGRWEGVEVRCGAAHQVLRHEAPRLPQETVVVSSLPFRSLPSPLRAVTVDTLCAFVSAHPARRLVQYTYQPRAPFELPGGSPLRWQQRRRVWGNLPPAGVWVLQHH
jgi:phospholipid N-methyltransferase